MKLKGAILTVLISLVVLTLLATSALLSVPVSAQVLYFTPTADASGAIYYIVKEGDVCETISLVNNINLETMRTLNSLDLDQCRFLQVGQKLLLGTVPTAVITPGPSPTPTSILPTPEPVKGFGTICIYLYDDVNGNAMAEESEITDTGLAGGAVSIRQKEGAYSNVGETLGNGESLCFTEIPEGEYAISIAIPEGYNPTSSQNIDVLLKAGDTSNINFSAQVSGSAENQSEGGEGDGSILLAVIGGLILLAGVGVGIYARYILKAR